MMESCDWTKAVGAFSQLGMMLIAVTALHTWKDQAKAKKQTDYLDELTDAVHEYIQALASPIQAFEFIRIGIESHTGDVARYGANASAIEYIERRGREDSAELWEKLGKANTIIARVNSLVARGQVYGFQDFTSGADSIRMLLWQHERLQVVASMIGKPSLNWEHPQVIGALEKMLTIIPSDIEAHRQKHDVEFIRFVEANYRQIYSGT